MNETLLRIKKYASVASNVAIASGLVGTILAVKVANESIAQTSSFAVIATNALSIDVAKKLAYKNIEDSTLNTIVNATQGAITDEDIVSHYVKKTFEMTQDSNHIFKSSLRATSEDFREFEKNNSNYPINPRYVYPKSDLSEKQKIALHIYDLSMPSANKYERTGKRIDSIFLKTDALKGIYDKQRQSSTIDEAIERTSKFAKWNSTTKSEIESEVKSALIDNRIEMNTFETCLILNNLDTNNIKESLDIMLGAKTKIENEKLTIEASLGEDNKPEYAVRQKI